MAIEQYKGHQPQIEAPCFVAASASVVGQVTIGAGSSVWHGAVVRGDMQPITIGQNTSVQDNVTVHVTPTQPVVVGDCVTIGHNAVVHACTIGNNCLIGMGSVILDGAKIGAGSIVGAGCVVPEGKEVPPRSLIVGVPGKVVRELDEAREQGLIVHAMDYRQLMEDYLPKEK